MEKAIEKREHRFPRLIMHPHCFLPRPKSPFADIGAVLSEKEVQRFMPLELSAGPVSLTPSLFFLGEIERKFALERSLPGPRRIVLTDIAINIKEAADQRVMHCHVHIIPRYANPADNPPGGIRGIVFGEPERGAPGQ